MKRSIWTITAFAIAICVLMLRGPTSHPYMASLLKAQQTISETNSSQPGQSSSEQSSSFDEKRICNKTACPLILLWDRVCDNAYWDGIKGSISYLIKKLKILSKRRCRKFYKKKKRKKKGKKNRK